MNYTQADIDEWMERLAIRNKECEQLERERDEARRELKLALEQWELCIEMSKK